MGLSLAIRLRLSKLSCLLLRLLAPLAMCCLPTFLPRPPRVNRLRGMSLLRPSRVLPADFSSVHDPFTNNALVRSSSALVPTAAAFVPGQAQHFRVAPGPVKTVVSIGQPVGVNAGFVVSCCDDPSCDCFDTNYLRPSALDPSSPTNLPVSPSMAMLPSLPRPLVDCRLTLRLPFRLLHSAS